jgi:hypothetical protein
MQIIIFIIVILHFIFTIIMNTKIYHSLFWTLAIFLLGSCSQSPQTSLLPTITGKPGEVVMIVDDNVWKSSVGDSLKAIFTLDYPSLPQEEPIFTATHIPHIAFSNIFKTHRNLLFVNIKQKLPVDSSKILIKQDIWANDQLIIDCQAPNTQTAANLIGKNKEKIISLINIKERHRIQKAYDHNKNKGLAKLIKNKFHINITIPVSYNLNKDTTNFIWISRETVNISQGIFIYSYPYNDTSNFSLQHIIEQRNNFLKRYIPGAVPNSWMTTEERLGLQIVRFRQAEKYYSEIRGLWRVENDFMGGPFISLTTTSTDGKQLITVEGYVYAPKHRKREYLRQMEAIVYSIMN